MPKKAKSPPLSGDMHTLVIRRLKTWRGWVVYHWDMGFGATLFKKKPEFDKDKLIIYADRSVEIDPYFLRACGVAFKFDLRGDVGRELYYGGDLRGTLEPMRLTLTLPVPLITLLNLP